MGLRIHLCIPAGHAIPLGGTSSMATLAIVDMTLCELEICWHQEWHSSLLWPLQRGADGWLNSHRDRSWRAIPESNTSLQ